MTNKEELRKEKILSSITQARRKILDVAYSLPPEKRTEVFLGEWSARDLLAHLIGWDYTNLEAAKSISAGKLPLFYSHHDKDWKTYNAFLIEMHNRGDFAELLYSLESSQRALMGFLATVPADEFDKDRDIRFQGYKVTIARLLEVQAKDDEEHYEQMKQFAESDSSPG